MTLQRLDTDNLQSLFNWMDFDGLLDMAESNARFHQIILNDCIVGKFGFQERLVHISNAADETSNGVRLASDRIRINGFRLARRILRQFGGQINRLAFNGSQFNGDQVQILGEEIAMHCGPTLRQLIVHSGKQSIFTNGNSPFKRCESLEVYNLDQNNGFPAFPRIFPKLHRVAVHISEPSNLAFLQHNLPDLRHVSVDLGGATTATAKANVKSFLQQNAQIVKLEIVSPIDAAFLAFVNAELLHLQQLNILIHPLDYAADELSDSLAFGTVTSLGLRVIGSGLMFTYFPVTFGQLRSLRIFCPEFDQHAAEFVVRSERLVKLEIYDSALYYAPWLAIIGALPELTEITAKVHSSYIESADEKNRLAAHPHLQRITILLSLLSDQSAWLKSMPSNWKLIDGPSGGRMTFVKDLADMSQQAIPS